MGKIKLLTFLVKHVEITVVEYDVASNSIPPHSNSRKSADGQMDGQAKFLCSLVINMEGKLGNICKPQISLIL